ncbi:MAG: hypothetical protein WA924_10095 [Burkholderiaceae bacterium]
MTPQHGSWCHPRCLAAPQPDVDDKCSILDVDREVLKRASGFDEDH